LPSERWLGFFNHVAIHEGFGGRSLLKKGKRDKNFFNMGIQGTVLSSAILLGFADSKKMAGT
jgi:hypothetical protein